MSYYEQVTHPPYRTGHGLQDQLHLVPVQKTYHAKIHLGIGPQPPHVSLLLLWQEEWLNASNERSYELFLKPVLQDHPARLGQYLEFSDEEKFFRDYE